METGIELIVAERNEQIEKHGHTILNDVHDQVIGGLSLVASFLCLESYGCMGDPEEIAEDHCPQGWDESYFAKLLDKPYKERLVIAGALIAAEIDRLNAIGD